MSTILKEIAIALGVGIVIFLIYGLILFLSGNPWYGDGVLTFFAHTMLFSVVLYFVNMTVFRWFLTRYQKDFWTLQKISLGIVSMVASTFVTVFLLRVFLVVGYYGQELIPFLESERLNNYYLSIVISFIATSVIYAFYYWKSKQDTKVKQSKIIAGTAAARFDALKNQLDPHFLFNSLNVLTSLIEENPDQAQKFTTSLSKVYRYVLEQKSKELISLDEELDFARVYMNLLKMRFEDSIVFEIPERASNPEAKIVPLSLQLLLENAVKHNMVTPSKRLRIKIEEIGNELVVSNNIQLKRVIKKSSGVGLQNIVQRYVLLTSRNVFISDDKDTFAVTLPLLTKNLSAATAQASSKAYIEDKRYQRAKERVGKLKEFYIHFAVYLIMVPVFIFFNIKSGGIPWALFPILGWGFGVASHASETYGWHPFLNSDWEQRKMKQLMDDEEF